MRKGLTSITCMAAFLLAGAPGLSVAEFEVFGQEHKPGCYECPRTDEPNAPKYHVVRSFRGDDKELHLTISISSSALKDDRLIALACRLEREYSGEHGATVFIFDSCSAANRYISPYAPEHAKGRGWQEFAKTIRAMYSRTPSSGDHWISWGFDPLTFKGGTTVELCPPYPKPSNKN